MWLRFIVRLVALGLAISVVDAYQHRIVLPWNNYSPVHRNTCLGLWVNAVHNQGVCILDVQERMSCDEVAYLFEKENQVFDPLPLEKVPKLLMQRARQEHALASKSSVLCANIDKSHRSNFPTSGQCPDNFYPHNHKCFGVSLEKVLYEEAQQLCKKSGGKLADDFEDHEVLISLVKYYVHQDVFTGLSHIEQLNDQPLVPSIDRAHVVVDYQSSELQYVVLNARRGFVCEVEQNLHVSYPSLPNLAALPEVEDDVYVHDLHPVKSQVDIDRYLVDLMDFHCYVSPGFGSINDYETTRIDLIENPPPSCAFKKSLGQVFIDLDNPTVKPLASAHECEHLVPLYRLYDPVNNRYRFELYVTMNNPKLKIFHHSYTPIGFCALHQGDCGATVPLKNSDSEKPICFLANHTLNLANELAEHRPLRFMQVAKRLNTIGKVEDDVVEVDKSLLAYGKQLRAFGGVLDSLKYKELSYYCSKLRPLYRLVNKKTEDILLTVNITQVQEERSQRDLYYEEELLGYVSDRKDYCGASVPLYHYTQIRIGSFPGQKQDIYTVRIMPKPIGIIDVPIPQLAGVVGYLF